MHAIKPLPFDASKLRGLSERLIVFFQNVNWDEVNRRFESARRKAA